METGLRRIFARKESSQPVLDHQCSPALPTSACDDGVAAPAPEIERYPKMLNGKPQQKKPRKLLSKSRDKRRTAHQENGVKGGDSKYAKLILPPSSRKPREVMTTFALKSQPSEPEQVLLKNYLLAVVDPNAPRLLVGNTFGNARLSPIRSPKHFDVLHAIVTERPISVSASDPSPEISPFNEAIADRNGSSGDGFFDNTQLSYNLYQEDVAERNLRCRPEHDSRQGERSVSTVVPTDGLRTDKPLPEVPHKPRLFRTHPASHSNKPSNDTAKRALGSAESEQHPNVVQACSRENTEKEAQQPHEIRHKPSMPDVSPIPSATRLAEKHQVVATPPPVNVRDELSQGDRNDSRDFPDNEEISESKSDTAAPKGISKDSLDALDLESNDEASLTSTAQQIPRQQADGSMHLKSSDGSAPAPSISTGQHSQYAAQGTRMLDLSPSFSVLVTHPNNSTKPLSARPGSEKAWLTIVDDSTEDEYCSSAERFHVAKEEVTRAHDSWPSSNVVVLRAFASDEPMRHRPDELYLPKAFNEPMLPTPQPGFTEVEQNRPATTGSAGRRRNPFSIARDFSWDAKDGHYVASERQCRGDCPSEWSVARKQKGVSVMTTATVDTIGSSILDFATAKSQQSTPSDSTTTKATLSQAEDNNHLIFRQRSGRLVGIDSGYGTNITNETLPPDPAAVRERLAGGAMSPSSDLMVTIGTKRPTVIHQQSELVFSNMRSHYESRGTQTSPIAEEDGIILSSRASRPRSMTAFFVPYNKVPARKSSLKPKVSCRDYFEQKLIESRA